MLRHKLLRPTDSTRPTLRPLMLAATLLIGLCAAMTATSQTVPGMTPSGMLPSDGTLLSVCAQAEARRVPDIANLSTGVVTQAADANAAMRANAEQMAKVV